MRVVLYTVAAIAALPASAQQTSVSREPSVAGYLCTFAGKCDGVEAVTETREAPETKGFRLARSTSHASEAAASTVSGRVPANAPRTAANARHRGASSHGTQSAGETRRANLANAAALPRAATSVPGIGRRADLMIGFELNSDRLTAEGRASARIFAQSLLTPELRKKRFLIAGHTDERGGRGINMPLSTRRAARVAAFLRAQGVAADRLETRGLGSTTPLPGLSAANPANRRVEAELIS